MLDETAEANMGPGVIPQPSSAPALLETLPFEIQRMILSQAPTFETLRALVHASPKLHRVYVQNRLPILRDLVEQTFDGFIVDVNVAYETGTNEFQQNRSESRLLEEIGAYEDRLTTKPARQLDLVENMSLEYIIQLVRFHRSVIEPLAERYAAWSLAALSSGTSPQSHPQSEVERRRIQRALYRLEVFCNLCGFRGEGRSAPVYIGTSIERLYVLNIFPAWQIEEILCVHAFAQHSYSVIFEQIDWDLDGPRQPGHISVQDLSLPSPPTGRKHT